MVQSANKDSNIRKISHVRIFVMKFVLTCCLAKSEMFHKGLSGSAIFFGITGSLLQTKQNIALKEGFLSAPPVKISLLPADFKTDILMLLHFLKDFRNFWFYFK